MAKTITFPYAVIYHGKFYPANTSIEVVEEETKKAKSGKNAKEGE
jgi:hypothetical protein